MKDFEYVGVHRRSSTKLVKGIGMNDVNLPTKILYNGIVRRCFFYEKWVSVLGRCTESYWEKHPYYHGTTICDEWLYYSNFREWMSCMNWEGMHLDKDIINPQSTEYSPSNCRFIPMEINLLLTDRRNHRGECPLGVTIDKSQKNKIYQAQCNIDGTKSKKLGRFLTPMEAHFAYQKAKSSEIKRVADKFILEKLIDEEIYDSLILRVRRIENDMNLGLETKSIHHF